MHSKQELCGKIKELYPEIGECGIDVDVEHDNQKNVWVVDLKKNKCVSLGLEIAQLRRNIEGQQF